MKASHLTTPRQLCDCAFTPSADPIERPPVGPSHETVGKFCAVLLLIVVVAIASGWLA
jgi:hypothetical protein